jgi:hypothetical protein
MWCLKTPGLLGWDETIVAKWGDDVFKCDSRGGDHSKCNFHLRVCI